MNPIIFYICIYASIFLSFPLIEIFIDKKRIKIEAKKQYIKEIKSYKYYHRTRIENWENSSCLWRIKNNIVEISNVKYSNDWSNSICSLNGFSKENEIPIRKIIKQFPKMFPNIKVSDLGPDIKERRESQIANWQS